MVDLKIAAHPGLDDAQKSAVERDYGMDNGLLILKSRVALAFYLKRRLNLDLDAQQITPERQQIFLTNAAEVEEVERMAKAEARARSSEAKSAAGARTS
jgi:hypothetical protein